MMRLSIERLDKDLPLPGYAHPEDAGLDLYAAQDMVLEPGQHRVAFTGVRVAVPYGHVGLIHPRSGLAARHGVTVLNAPGTIDAGYRGEIGVVLINHGRDPHIVRRGDRIAQLLVQRIERPQVVETADLGNTTRGPGGFGSTGA